MDRNSITYGEIEAFKNKLNNLTPTQIVDFLVETKEIQEVNKLKEELLNLFPKFENQRLEITFVDFDKTMAVVTVYRNEEIISYLSYINTYGVTPGYFNSFDQAIVGCLAYKHGRRFTKGTPPYFWINKMLDIPDTINGVIVNKTDEVSKVEKKPDEEYTAPSPEGLNDEQVALNGPIVNNKIKINYAEE